MKKKVISIILILVMLLLPFSTLLNVNATIQTEKGISYDDTITNGKGYKITSVSENGVVLSNLGSNDEFAMYKLLDVYYDATSNQISYDFTTSFKSFADSQSPQVSVDDYLTAQTGGDHGSEYEDSSAFNALVSKYATYVRTNNVSSTYQMTTTSNNSGEGYQATKTNTEAGVYLILPSSNGAKDFNGYGFDMKTVFAYGVMIANVVPSAAANNNWEFSQVEINAKNINSIETGWLIDRKAENVLDVLDNGNGNFAVSLNYSANNSYSFFTIEQANSVPENAHSSIKALIDNNLLNMVDIIYPTTLTPDLTDLYYFDFEHILDARIANNKYYVTNNNSEEFEFADVTTSTGKMSFDYSDDFDSVFSIIFNLDIDDDSLSNAAAGNIITTVSYTVKDPYVDIGTVTKEDIKNAFDSTDANYSSTKSVNIRRAIEKVEQNVTLYTTGITVNNTNSSNNNLTGAEFAVYSTYENGTYSNQLGNNIVINDGTGLLNGLDPAETYYLKQVKAPSGYRLYDDKIIVLKGTNDETNYDLSIYEVLTAVDGMYTANVVNSPMLALPFTGGAGTIIYTVIGLVVVAGAITFIIIYKKKNKKDK